MRFFATQILIPYILDHDYKNILEIGSAYGQNADQILRGKPEVKISIIDPCVSTDLENKYKNNQKVRFYKGLSLEMFPKVKDKFDCILIDGDHNYYTIFGELSAIHNGNLLEKGGTIFFHDVCWPYAKRDMYYDPNTIPREHRHPHAKRGMIRGESELVNNGGFNKEVDNALFEGGPKNGVLTAIEDFLKNKNEYAFFSSKSQYGLGIMVKKGDNYISKYAKWYLKTKIFDAKTFVRPFIKRLRHKNV